MVEVCYRTRTELPIGWLKSCDECMVQHDSFCVSFLMSIPRLRVFIYRLGFFYCGRNVSFVSIAMSLVDRSLELHGFSNFSLSSFLE